MTSAPTDFSPATGSGSTCGATSVPHAERRLGQGWLPEHHLRDWVGPTSTRQFRSRSRARQTTLVREPRPSPAGQQRSRRRLWRPREARRPSPAGTISSASPAGPRCRRSRARSTSAGAGDDVVVMPDAPVAGFDPAGSSGPAPATTGSCRRARPQARLRVGRRYLVLKDAVIGWGNKENRDNDGLVVVRAGDARYQVTNAEILRAAASRTRCRNGTSTLSAARRRLHDHLLRERHAHRPGRRLLRRDGGVRRRPYEASFLRLGALGGAIELSDVAGFGHVLVHEGAAAAPRATS